MERTNYKPFIFWIWPNTTRFLKTNCSIMVSASKEIIPVLSLCCLWYLVSSGSNVVGKTLLNQFPYPMTVTMVQLLSISIYSGPFFNLWGVRRFVEISWPYYFKLIVPLALGKFIGSVFTHVSLWKVPVSYTHTGI